MALFKIVIDRHSRYSHLAMMTVQQDALLCRLSRSCFNLPDQHAVDDALLVIAQTAMIGEQTLDVGAGVAADELAIP